MIKVGLTGNRYSGKTEISAMFRKIGVPVFDADTCIKFLINHNFEYNLKLQKRLSYDVWDENGFLSQKKLTTEQLDSAIDIIQFELFDLFDKFTKRNFHSPYYVFTSSILFERNWHLKFDYNINIFAPQNHRVERCILTSNKTYMEVYDLINTEVKDELKNSKANWVIHNYDTAPDVMNSVQEIDNKIIDIYLNKQK